jgi:hypothetical protein
MKGFPKTVNTKQDILNLLPDFPAETTEYLRKLLNERKHWSGGSYVENPNAVLFQMGFTTQEALNIVTDYVEPAEPEPPLTPEQEAERELQAWRNTADCSALQAEIVIHQMGLTAQVDAIKNDPATPIEAKLALEKAYRWSRKSPLWDYVGPKLDPPMTPEQIDDLFKAAQQIEV